MLNFFKNNLLWSEGLHIFIVLVVLAVVSLFFFKPLFYLVFAFFIFSLFFFRNPDRVCVESFDDMSVLVCPADGKVVDIVYDENNGLEGYAQRVSIFLSPFNVHVNWVPMSGVIQDIQYKKGQFKMAFLPKSSELNERNDLLVTDKNSRTIKVRQIAGTLARRICCWVNKGESVRLGQKYGMIRFGSRVDIFLPSDISLNVGLGQKVYGGKTVLGRWSWH